MSEEIKKEENKTEKKNKSKTKGEATKANTASKETTKKKTINKNENVGKDNKKTKEEKVEKEVEIHENVQLTKTKKEKNILTVKQQKELETIEKEIKTQEELEKTKLSKAYVNVFKNIVYAIITIIYFIIVIICKNYIQPNIFITILKIFSMILIFGTICVFEIAYKKDSGKLAVTGIENLIISICTLISIRIYSIFNNKFVSSIASFGLLFSIYYVGKALRGYLKEKKQVKKEISDISNIH